MSELPEKLEQQIHALNKAIAFLKVEVNSVKKNRQLFFADQQSKIEELEKRIAKIPTGQICPKCGEIFETAMGGGRLIEIEITAADKLKREGWLAAWNCLLTKIKETRPEDNQYVNALIKFIEQEIK